MLQHGGVCLPGNGGKNLVVEIQFPLQVIPLIIHVID